MRIWIDMANSPHPLLFAPVARHLVADGHEVLVTARDNAQTAELTLQRWPGARIFGAESPAGRRAKLASLRHRIAKLRRWAAAERPDVALSHNSYAQIVAASSLGIRTVTAMDFEHQPANHLAFRLARTVLLPEALTARLVRGQGARPRKVRRYRGLKEELYLADFEPDASVEATIGPGRSGATALVLARTPPSRAVYHRFDNPLFEAALRRVCSQGDVLCVVLTRHVEQRAAIRDLGLDGCVVPDHAIDSRSLMFGADLFLGAGGTMTREAALLGVPAYSLFAGRPAAVDDWLIRRGLLHRLERAEQLPRVKRRGGERAPSDGMARRGRAILETFVDATLAQGRRGGAASRAHGCAAAESSATAAGTSSRPDHA